MPEPANLTERNGLRLFSPAAALVRIPESFFGRQPIETQVVLAGLRDASDLLRLLLERRQLRQGRRAGRRAPADRPPRARRRDSQGDEAAGYDARESDPFEAAQTFGVLAAGGAAHRRPHAGDVEVDAGRSHRRIFRQAPGLPRDKGAYLEFVDDIYKSDAYHSLSIEGYSVTPQLIERVQQGNWDPDHHDDDRKSRDALAARGYWQAFQKVKRRGRGDHRGRESRRARARDAHGLVSRAVSALRGGRNRSGGRPRGLPK